jgi:uncharacterized protein YbaR (Trm112 family)
MFFKEAALRSRISYPEVITMVCPRCGLMIFGFPEGAKEIYCKHCGQPIVLRDYIPGILKPKENSSQQPSKWEQVLCRWGKRWFELLIPPERVAK